MVIMNIRKNPIGQQIKWSNNLTITTRITLSMVGRLRFMNGYSVFGGVINQEEVTIWIENYEALGQSINAYLELGSK